MRGGVGKGLPAGWPAYLSLVCRYPLLRLCIHRALRVTYCLGSGTLAKTSRGAAAVPLPRLTHLALAYPLCSAGGAGDPSCCAVCCA